MMVATAGGNQVRMIRAPPPMTLPRGGTTLTLPPGTTLVRGPPAAGMRPGVPQHQQQQQISVVRPPASVVVSTPTQTTAPPLTKPTVHVQVPGYQSSPSGGVAKVVDNRPPPTLQVPPPKQDSGGSLINKGAQHPAALPPTPRYIDDPKKKRIPPKPALKITKAASGLVLSWNMTFNTLYADIQTYQLYAYQETNSAPATSHWKKVGDVRALPLPMACTLTQFVEGHKYHFAVRAVDVHNRLGPFSDPSSILLK